MSVWRDFRTLLLLFGGLAVALLLGVGLLFDGDLDFGGHYEIVQTVPYSRERTAFEVERWDRQALGGLRYAVVVSDYRPSTKELRRALISVWKRGSFELAGPRVTMRWAGPDVLVLSSDAPGSNPDWVTRQRRRLGEVKVDIRVLIEIGAPVAWAARPTL